MTMGKVLLVDYGGVLTAPVKDSFVDFEAEHGMPEGALMPALSRAWAGDDGGLIARFERGEIANAEFERDLAAYLAMDGWDIDPSGLIPRLFKSAPVDGGMWPVVARARNSGIRTGLLSNSWGVDGYPYDRLHAVFDDLVISGDVGLRKPDAAIYELAMDRFDARPEQCAFVDDFFRNVDAATELGMHGVVHETVEQTVAQLESFLGVSLT